MKTNPDVRPACTPNRPSGQDQTARALSLAAALLLAWAGSACNGGGSGGGGGTTQDLEVTALETDSPTGYLGHELRATVYVEAANAADDVGVAFLVADAAEVDAGVAEPVLQLVDARSIAAVQAGENAYTLAVDLPADTLTAGNYYLLAVVDPIDDTAETDEEGNSYTVEEIEQLGVRVTLSAAQPNPDLVLTDGTLDRFLVEIDVTPDVHTPMGGGIGEVQNGEIGVTVTLRASARQEIANVDIGAWLELPGSGIQQLQLWDTVSQTYRSTIRLASLAPDEHSAVHLDAILSTATRNQLAASVGTVLQTRVLVFVDPNGVIPEFESGIVETGDGDGDGFDNGMFLPIALRISNEPQHLLGGAASEVAWDIPFVKNFSNGNAGVGLRFGAQANVGANGIHAEAQASVPVTLAGSTFDLLNLSAVGLYNPLHKSDNGMVATLKAANKKLYETRTKEDQALASTPLSFHTEQKVSTTFMVGPVPLFVTLGAGGTVGLDLGANIGNAFALAAMPHLDLDAFGEGGVGASSFGWTLGGGLGANLKLVDEKFHAGITATVAYDSGTSVMTGTVAEVVANELAGPSGRLYLFATAEGKILWKTISERWEYVLANWAPFVKNDTIFSKSQSVSVTIP